MARTVERDVLVDTGTFHPCRDADACCLYWTECREDAVFRVAAFTKHRSCLCVQVKIFKSAGLLLREHDARACMPFLHFTPLQFHNVAPAQPGQTRKEKRLCKVFIRWRCLAKFLDFSRSDSGSLKRSTPTVGLMRMIPSRIAILKTLQNF